MDYKQHLPDFAYEEKHWQQNRYVIGIDEVGRGALAGAIYVGAVCLPINLSHTMKQEILEYKINDSKKLSHQQRLKLVPLIKKHALATAVCYSDVEMINTKGIIYSFYQAALKAVAQITDQLGKGHEWSVLVDAFTIPGLSNLGIKIQEAIIKGDCKSISIAGASILSKVERDDYITRLSSEFRAYQWDNNKGYGVKSHRMAIREYGLTPYHRKLYVRRILNRV